MIEKRALGNNGPDVSCIGYGAMTLEGYYGASDDERAVATIHRALDAGMNMIDTADAYDNGQNETLAARAIAGRREQAFLATKFGMVFDEGETGTDLATGWGFSLRINGRPPYVRRSLEASLKRLRVDVIDLWYAHYADPGTRHTERVAGNAHAADIRLTEALLRRIGEQARPGLAEGATLL